METLRQLVCVLADGSLPPGGRAALAPYAQPLEVPVSTDVTIPLVFKTADGKVKDMTGWTAFLTVRTAGRAVRLVEPVDLVLSKVVINRTNVKDPGRFDVYAMDPDDRAWRVVEPSRWQLCGCGGT